MKKLSLIAALTGLALTAGTGAALIPVDAVNPAAEGPSINYLGISYTKYTQTISSWEELQTVINDPTYGALEIEVPKSFTNLPLEQTITITRNDALKLKLKAISVNSLCLTAALLWVSI